MTKEREALRLALENLLQATRHLNACPATVEAAEKALAQSEQWTPEDTAYRPGSLVRTEPDPTPEQLAALGWQSIECPFCGTSGAQAFPKSEWVGLTPADYDAMRPCVPSTVNDFSFCDVAAIIEAKLKEKNA